MAGKDAKQKWQEANRAILDALDIGAEYERLGLRIPTGKKARATGWLECHAADAEDATPSAEINVGDGSARGRYRSFRGNGETLSLFDFAAKYGGAGAGDWREARKAFARQANVKLPNGEEELPADKLDFFDLTVGMQLNFARSKPGVEPTAIAEAGGRGARWPKNLAPELTQHCICFPAYGAGLTDGDPHGFAVVNAAGGKLKKYRGKGVDPDLLKVMTLGTPGLMNVWALRRLATSAEVVWIVEGVSDMLAVHSAIPAELKETHVVVTCGGCTYRPQAEWLHHFAGKDVRICFDIDPDDAGQNGAKVWVGVLVNVAASVRNVALPFDKGGELKDLRDYLTAAGKSYSDLWELSETTEPIGKEQAEAEKVEPHEAILSALGVQVCGQIKDTDHVEIFSTKLHKRTTIKDLDRFSYAKATLALGGETADRYLTESMEPVPGKFQIRDVRNAIAKAAAGQYVSDTSPVGAGVWPVPGGLVLVNYRSADLWNGRRELEITTTPAIRGQRIDFASEPWYDRVELGKFLALAADVDWRTDVMDEAISLFGRWDNWSHEWSAEIVAALVAATWVQTAWAWRPLVGVLGATNTGKSILIEDCLPVMMAPAAVHCAKPSEAGLRIAVGNTAKAVFVDEFEDDFHRGKILELLRTSGRGSKVLRGTSSQKAAAYGFKHVVWVASTELGLRHAADKNRFVLLELDKLPPGAPSKLKLPDKAELRLLGQKMLAVAVQSFDTALAISGSLRQRTFGVDRRIVESFSIPAAMLAAAIGQDEDAAAAMLERWLAARNFVDQEESEEQRLVAAILEAVVILPGGHRFTVGQLLTSSSQLGHGGQAVSREEVLGTVGLKIVDGGVNLFVAVGAVTRELLAKTDFARMSIGQILARITGASKCVKRIPHPTKGVLIPMASLDDLLPQMASENCESNAF